MLINIIDLIASQNNLEDGFLLNLQHHVSRSPAKFLADIQARSVPRNHSRGLRSPFPHRTEWLRYEEAAFSDATSARQNNLANRNSVFSSVWCGKVARYQNRIDRPSQEIATSLNDELGITMNTRFHGFGHCNSSRAPPMINRPCGSRHGTCHRQDAHTGEREKYSSTVAPS